MYVHELHQIIGEMRDGNRSYRKNYFRFEHHKNSEVVKMYNAMLTTFAVECIIHA